MARAMQKRVFGDTFMHPRSLIRAFAAHLHIHWTLKNLSTESKCSDEILRMYGINLNLCILRMLEDTFLLGAAHTIRINRIGYSSLMIITVFI